ncbi:ribonuclease R [Christiangramia flava]|uniref:Ribonuclease R n=1 Tax=Christiangramia flava JLT2011 TaxID=1229726 RepID=A0A1L7I3B2_9FLAO|nr:ribonuclease R [Christiangramia flava]APU68108.1 3'-to-5' exoribonuclease RNase R [Christiangramia flava JLT2011]OSS37624.1 3'-to-5' exoribonuclease RNase R [Christiangramia flava JLT2011]
MKKKKKTRNKTQGNLSKTILDILRKNSGQAYNYKQVAAAMGVNDASSRNQIIKKLAQLAAKKQITQIDRGKYVIEDSNDYYTGVLDLTTKGYGYVMVPELADDIFIANKDLNAAFNGDTVEVYVFNRRRKKRSEGEITKILKRKRTEFVGTLQKKKDFGFVVVDEASMYTDFFISGNKMGDAQDGDKVVVEFDEWPERADSPFGRITRVLGTPGEHQTEIHSILAQYGLPHEFPEKVEEFANSLDTSINQEEIARRRDMRDILTFTIDPKDAKDFDDALSFRELENGNYEIGIHIADVSHYVKPNTILDEEAYDRATSVYLVDRVVPMLPEILSNNACSLRPEEEKFTFSAVFEIDDQATVKKEWFGRTVTYSDERFAYEEAQHIIETNSGTIPEEISIRNHPYTVKGPIVEAVVTLNRLAKKMRSRRMRGGAISFDKVEVKFNLDENNDPTGVFFKVAKDANKLIEEFMLLANRKVAEFIGKQKPKKTFVYRCHDEPDEEKLQTLQNIVGRFGHQLNLKDRKTTTSSLNKLLEDVQGRREQNMVDTLAIRSMSKAYYGTENIGHYGLAFDYYTHFTSPIRRYPDVMVHRLLQHYLDKNESASEEEYENKCHHSSEMENLASNAERDSIKYMQVKFMQDHENEDFLGVISGVTEWGIFVEIVENKCEGMIRLRDLNDDHYEFDPKEFAVTGRKTGKTFTLGDEVYVRVKNADLIKRHLDFSMVGSREEVED